MPNIQTGKSGMQYIDRGDLAGYDYTIGDLTADLNWHDLDISAKVPAGTKLVLFFCNLQANNANRHLYLKNKDNANDFNISRCTVPVANQGARFDCLIACNADRHICYKLSITTWANVDISIKGYVLK